ncbi:MAG: hypothetical protein ACPHK8_06705 [Thermoplasmatota archaeon]
MILRSGVSVDAPNHFLRFALWWAGGILLSVLLTLSVVLEWW